jgi:hypothetical protein
MRYNLTFYVMLLSFYFLQSCASKLDHMFTTVKVSTSTQPTRSDNEFPLQISTTPEEPQGEGVIKEHIENVNALAELQEKKEATVYKNKHAKPKHKVSVQYTMGNMQAPIIRQKSFKSRTLYNALRQGNDKLIINNINNLIINSAPHGQVLVRTIQQALNSNNRDTLLFKQIDLQEQDFVQLANHPFFKEECKKLICFKSPRSMQASTLEALGEVLQRTQIEELHLVGNCVDSNAIIAFLNNLKYSKVRILNLSNNRLSCNMVEFFSSLIGTNISNVDLSKNVISIPLADANAISGILYRTQIQQVNLMVNPIEPQVQQLLRKRHDSISWEFLQLKFVELF